MSNLNWTPSETRQRANRLLDAHVAELDESKVAGDIDAPIDAVLTDLTLLPQRVCSYGEFLSAVADFIARVNGAGSQHGVRIAMPIALDEAVASLRAYEGPTSSGHDAAVVDARREDGTWVELVLARLGEAMKAARREARWRRLESQYTAGVDWGTRCEMVRLLLERAQPFLPQEILSCPPEQLAGHLFELVRIVAS
jgi:hypothetical protein